MSSVGDNGCLHCRMEIPRYMHILIPVQRNRMKGESWWAPHNEEVWQGRMVHLERKIRYRQSRSSCIFCFVVAEMSQIQHVGKQCTTI